jgi:hypothetical protein
MTNKKNRNGWSLQLKTEIDFFNICNMILREREERKEKIIILLLLFSQNNLQCAGPFLLLHISFIVACFT